MLRSPTLIALSLVAALMLGGCGNDPTVPDPAEDPAEPDPDATTVPEETEDEPEGSPDGPPDEAETAIEPLTDDRSIEDRTDEGAGGLLTVTDVRIGAHEGFDRIVFEIAGDGAAGWHIGYVDEPTTQGEGAPVDITGEAFLEVIVRGVALPPDAPEHDPWDGERLAGPPGSSVTELVDDTIYEGQHVFHVGLPEESPFGVVRLDDPQRIVVEIAHP